MQTYSDYERGKVVKPIETTRSTNSKPVYSLSEFSGELAKACASAEHLFGNVGVNGQQFEALFDSMPQGMALNKLITDKNGEPADFLLMQANKAYADMAGLPKEALLLKGLTSTFPLTCLSPEGWLVIYASVAVTGKPEFFEAFRGEKCYHVYVYSLLQGYCFSVFNDVTDQKMRNQESTRNGEYEDQLRQNAEKYQYIIKHAPTGIYEIEVSGERFRSVNELLCRTLGFTEEELLSMNPLDLLFPQSRKRFQQRMQNLLDGKKIDDSVEYHVKTKNGNGLWVVMQVNYLYKNGKVDGVLVVAHDVTERKRSEHALLNAEKRYRRLYETTQDGIMARDLEGKMINCNPAYAKMLGYTKKELRGLSVKQLIPERWHEQREKVAKKVLQTGRSIVFEREYRRKNGTIFSASVRTWRLTDGKGKVIGIWSIVRDISEQKRLQKNLEAHADILEKIVADREKQLKDSERLVAIGQTAGMVGHDLRNPLQTLVGELYLAKTEVDSLGDGDAKSNLQESIKVIEEQVLYMDKIVSDLQAFVRPVKIDKEPLILQELLSSVLQTVTIPAAIVFRIQNPKDPLQIKADPHLLKRVLINLVTNAVQAMPKGGKLTVSCNQNSEERVFISVQDTGVGIPDRIKNQIFTPLFTTKPRGQGFGLAVCKRVIEAHGGAIMFESTEGKGTVFTIQLPLS